MELRVTRASTLMVLMLLDITSCLGDKLSAGQKAPPFAKGAGGLALRAPYESGGPQAADVGQRRVVQNSPPAAAPSSGSAQVDGVVREETEELKEVDGQLVRVVKGNFAYDSPEGLPIAVKYVADENGNRASFTFGTGKPSGGPRTSGGRNKPGLTPGGPGATSLGGGGRGGAGSGGTKNGRTGGAPGGGNRPGGGSSQGGASTYLPPTTKVDRSYLPPN